MGAYIAFLIRNVNQGAKEILAIQDSPFRQEYRYFEKIYKDEIDIELLKQYNITQQPINEPRYDLYLFYPNFEYNERLNIKFRDIDVNQDSIIIEDFQMKYQRKEHKYVYSNTQIWHNLIMEKLDEKIEIPFTKFSEYREFEPILEKAMYDSIRKAYYKNDNLTHLSPLLSLLREINKQQIHMQVFLVKKSRVQNTISLSNILQFSQEDSIIQIKNLLFGGWQIFYTFAVESASFYNFDEETQENVIIEIQKQKKPDQKIMGYSQFLDQLYSSSL